MDRKTVKPEEVLELCKRIAIEAHKGQQRRSGGPYIEHPARMADNTKERTIASICWLHDVVEDTDWTITRLHDEGVLEVIQRAVDVLTKRRDEPYLDYLLRIRANIFAWQVKLLDLKDNLSDLEPGKLRDKYLMAQYILR